jgi:hypothetical protein
MRQIAEIKSFSTDIPCIFKLPHCHEFNAVVYLFEVEFLRERPCRIAALVSQQFRGKIPPPEFLCGSARDVLAVWSRRGGFPVSDFPTLIAPRVRFV